jgi:hypothetical protein
MTEEERAAAYRVQAVNRAAFWRFLESKLVPPAAPLIQLRAKVAPLIERTKPGEREPKQDRPVQIANG